MWEFGKSRSFVGGGVGALESRGYEPCRVSTLMRFRVHFDASVWPLSRVSTFVDTRIGAEETVEGIFKYFAELY